MLAWGERNPDAGVAATSPEITPEQRPTIDHFFASLKSSKVQVIPEKAAVRLEFQQAITARRFAPKAEPPLNPSHPNHRRIVPSVMSETL
jgi:hypothetical protein